MASKVNNNGKDKEIGECKSEKQNVHWTISNKTKMFIDLVLEQNVLAIGRLRPSTLWGGKPCKSLQRESQRVITV